MRTWKLLGGGDLEVRVSVDINVMSVSFLYVSLFSSAIDPHVFSIFLLAPYPGTGVKGRRKTGEKGQRRNKNEDKR